jgi:hypothetical protein
MSNHHLMFSLASTSSSIRPIHTPLCVRSESFNIRAGPLHPRFQRLVVSFPLVFHLCS